MAAKRNQVGRPSKFRPEYVDQAFKFCLLGATDAELGRFFDVDERTINNWKEVHPEFFQSLKDGKEGADACVAQSLYRRALGWEHEAVKIVADAKTGTEHIVPYTERYPPDTTAAIFWLKNRRPDLWRDKHSVEHAGPEGGPVTMTAIEADEAKERLFDALARIADRMRQNLEAQRVVGDGAAPGGGTLVRPLGSTG